MTLTERGQRMGQAEFIALIAMTFATIAFSIDSMLPALPRIGAELSPGDINRAQLVLTAFVLGMGLGTFVTGPLSDAFGRKPVIYAGAVIYVIGAFAAWVAPTLEVMLAARVIQGLGAAAPRVVSLAIMRDLYSGRVMARMMSIAMMVFAIFPAFAPLLGTGIIVLVGWRGIFLGFVLFTLIAVLWLGLRLREPLPVPARRPFRPALLVAAARELMLHKMVRLTIIVQGLCLGMIFTMITMVQQVYDLIFLRAESFPFWFATIAIISASASLVNAVIVVRFGMRRITTWALGFEVLWTLAVMILVLVPALPDPLMFPLFLLFQASVFLTAGMTIGNLNAMAMEPMGHIAGMAASVIGGLSTVMAAMIAAPIGLLFDGTLRPMVGGILIMAAGGFLLMLRIRVIERREGRRPGGGSAPVA
ncbi:MFS transporter [Pontibaca methylaminivorans]|uniref:MFS transporter n=1 Tax=Pontibaca methylaminivorans TaxID=515897 RepID=UPI002FDAE2F4